MFDICLGYSNCVPAESAAGLAYSECGNSSNGDCLSLHIMLITMRYLRELTYVVTLMLTHQLVSIAVIFQLMLSMMIVTSQ